MPVPSNPRRCPKSLQARQSPGTEEDGLRHCEGGTKCKIKQMQGDWAGRAGEPRRQARHHDGPSQAYLREIRQQVPLIMLFQPIEFLCIHGKCNQPYAIEKKIEKMQKQKNKNEVLSITYKIHHRKEKKNPDSRLTVHLVRCANFISEVHSFKYPLVIHAFHIIYIIYNWKRHKLPFLTNIQLHHT